MSCRLCEDTNSSTLIDLFREDTQKTLLINHILLTTSVEIKEDDLASKQVCKKCLQTVLSMALFRVNAINTDRKVKEKAGQHFEVIPLKSAIELNDKHITDLINKLYLPKVDVSTQTLRTPILSEQCQNQDNQSNITSDQTITKKSSKPYSVTRKPIEMHKSVRRILKETKNLRLSKKLYKIDFLPVVHVERMKFDKTISTQLDECNYVPSRIEANTNVSHILQEKSRNSRDPRIKKNCNLILKRRSNENVWDIFNKKKPMLENVVEEPITEEAQKEQFIAVLGLRAKDKQTVEDTRQEKANESLNTTYSEMDSLIEIQKVNEVHICNVCSKLFLRMRDLKKHLETHKCCIYCRQHFASDFVLTRHLKLECKDVPKKEIKINLKRLEEDPALKKFLVPQPSAKPTPEPEHKSEPEHEPEPEKIVIQECIELIEVIDDDNVSDVNSDVTLCLEAVDERMDIDIMEDDNFELVTPITVHECSENSLLKENRFLKGCMKSIRKPLTETCTQTELKDYCVTPYIKTRTIYFPNLFKELTIYNRLLITFVALNQNSLVSRLRVIPRMEQPKEVVKFDYSNIPPIDYIPQPVTSAAEDIIDVDTITSNQTNLSSHEKIVDSNQALVVTKQPSANLESENQPIINARPIERQMGHHPGIPQGVARAVLLNQGNQYYTNVLQVTTTNQIVNLIATQNQFPPSQHLILKQTSNVSNQPYPSAVYMVPRSTPSAQPISVPQTIPTNSTLSVQPISMPQVVPRDLNANSTSSVYNTNGNVPTFYRPNNLEIAAPVIQHTNQVLGPPQILNGLVSLPGPPRLAEKEASKLRVKQPWEINRY